MGIFRNLTYIARERAIYSRVPCISIHCKCVKLNFSKVSYCLKVKLKTYCCIFDIKIAKFVKYQDTVMSWYVGSLGCMLQWQLPELLYLMETYKTYIYYITLKTCFLVISFIMATIVFDVYDTSRPGQQVTRCPPTCASLFTVETARSFTWISI